jgi:hypothetical protein
LCEVCDSLDSDFVIKITVWWDETQCNPLVVTMDKGNYHIICVVMEAVGSSDVWV